MADIMTTGPTARWSWALRLVTLALLAPISLFAAPPQRIVSMNVCTDQLLLSLVERKRIASLSYIAADARTSGIADQVGSIPLNRGIAEEIVALAPDFIVTAQFGFRSTVGMLRRLGYAVVELPMAETLTDVAQNLRTLGTALGVEAHAAELARAFEQRLARLTYNGSGERPLFVNYDANGWTTGQTGLLADIVHRAGLSTPGDRLGFAQSARLTIEGLVLLRPPLMDLGYPWDDPPALASEHRRHPAVQAVLRGTTVVDIPDSTWLCGTPQSLDALERLRNERAALISDDRP
ncbi:MAG TPA: ABC transporter substrate-binding protein [Gammaproteobacteria bacterium]|nr:ABC transporter substrate-binding protein [Gammaproteobacteria bacterium]